MYRPAPGWSGGVAIDTQPAGGDLRQSASAHSGFMSVDLVESNQGRADTNQDIQSLEKSAREEGFKEGLDRGKAEQEAAAKKQKEAIVEAIREFSTERNAYFHQVEGEVVALALAIVRKILRRESQLDPLLLSGLVRVALEKMASGMNIRLRVNPSQIPAWQTFLGEAKDLSSVPELLGDGSLDQNQCHLETEHGSTDLNLETQLKEIEQGLFDLLAQRPAPR